MEDNVTIHSLTWLSAYVRKAKNWLEICQDSRMYNWYASTIYKYISLLCKSKWLRLNNDKILYVVMVNIGFFYSFHWGFALKNFNLLINPLFGQFRYKIKNNITAVQTQYHNTIEMVWIGGKGMYYQNGKKNYLQYLLKGKGNTQIKFIIGLKV